MSRADEMTSFARFLGCIACGALHIALLSFLIAAAVRPDLVAARLMEVLL